MQPSEAARPAVIAHRMSSIVGRSSAPSAARRARRPRRGQLPEQHWHKLHLFGGSSQTLAIGLLAAATAADSTLANHPAPPPARSQLLLRGERPVLVLLAQPISSSSVERPSCEARRTRSRLRPGPYGPRLRADRATTTSAKQVSTGYRRPGQRLPNSLSPPLEVPTFDPARVVLLRSFGCRRQCKHMAWTADEVLHRVIRIERSARLPAVGALVRQGQLGVGEDLATALRQILRLMWPDAEHPSANERHWLRLFRAAGYVSDTDEELEERLVIHRGVGRPRYARGISWTLDYERAVWFARRYGANSARMYTVEIASDQALRFFVGRNESEVVVNPDDLPTLRGQVRPQPPL